jgi:hypothetical protein
MSSGTWTYPVSSAAPAPGSVLALDSTGANIVAAPAMPLKIASGTFTISGTVPANGVLTGNVSLSGLGAVASDTVIVNPTGQVLGTGMNVSGWNTGALTLYAGLQGNGGSLVWSVINSSNTAIALTAGTPNFSYMVVR